MNASTESKEELLETPSYNYKLSIKMSSEAVKKLQDANLHLCLIKQIVSYEPEGDLLPTIWVSTPDFGTETVFTWREEHGAYLSNSKRDEAITPISSYPSGRIGSIEFSEEGEKILAKINETKFRHRGFIIFWNLTNSDLTAGVFQNIQMNGKELGLAPITVQTLNKCSHKTIDLPESVLVTFMPSTIKTGQVVMKHSEYPSMLVSYDASTNEREIIWEIRSLEDKLIEPGFWYNSVDENWGVEISKTCNLHRLLNQTDRDPSKQT